MVAALKAPRSTISVTAIIFSMQGRPSPPIQEPIWGKEEGAVCSTNVLSSRTSALTTLLLLMKSLMFLLCVCAANKGPVEAHYSFYAFWDETIPFGKNALNTVSPSQLPFPSILLLF
jgi:hypothetical protein